MLSLLNSNKDDELWFSGKRITELLGSNPAFLIFAITTKSSRVRRVVHHIQNDAR